MKEKINELLKNVLIQRSVRIFFGVLAFYFVITIWKWEKLPPQIPLFYSLPKGTEQLAGRIFLLIFPFFSLVFFIVDFLIASYLYRQEKLAAYILVILGNVVSILLFIAFIKIIFLIT